MTSETDSGGGGGGGGGGASSSSSSDARGPSAVPSNPPDASDEVVVATTPPPAAAAASAKRKKTASELLEEETTSSRVRVTDPKQHGEGRKGHTSYLVVLIAVQDGAPIPRGPPRRRRYGDFRWLHRRLVRSNPGSIVPPLPHRSAVRSETRFSDELLNYRRRTCEGWADRILGHPELKDEDCVEAFFRGDDERFATAKGGDEWADSGDEATARGGPQSPKADRSPESGGASDRVQGVMDGITKLARGITTKITRMRKSEILAEHEEEDKFEALEAYATKIDQQTQAMVKGATAVIKCANDRGHTLDLMGNRFKAVGKLNHPGVVNSDIPSYNATANAVAESVRFGSAAELKIRDALKLSLLEPAEELRLEAKSLRDACDRRREKQAHLTNRNDAIRTKESYCLEVEDKPHPDLQFQRNRERQAANELRYAKRDAETAKVEFDATCRALLRDAERFQTEFANRLRAFVLRWATAQMELNDLAGDVWKELKREAVLG